MMVSLTGEIRPDFLSVDTWLTGKTEKGLRLHVTP